MRQSIVLNKTLLWFLPVVIIWLVITHWLTVFSSHSSRWFRPHVVVNVSGWVDSLPRCTRTRCRFDFSLSKVMGQFVHGKIRVYWYGHHAKIRAGQYMRFSFKTYISHSFRTKKVLWSARLLARGGVVRTNAIKIDTSKDNYRSMVAFRQSIENIIQHAVQGNSIRASIAALTIGARNLLSNSDWRVYQATGTSHLVAISGLHFGIVYLIIYCVILRFCCLLCFWVKSYPMQVIAQYTALLLTCFYAFLVGMSLPAERAWLMLLLAVIPGMFVLQLPLWRRIALAMLVIIMFNPAATTQASFWLSFSAVSILAYVLRSRVGTFSRFGEWLRLNLAVTVGLLPLTLWYFYKVSLIAAITNFFAVPWVTLLIVPCCLLAVLAAFFSTNLAANVFHLAALLFAPLWHILLFFSRCRGALFYVHSLTIPCFILGLFGVCIFLSPLPLCIRIIGLGYCLVFVS
jgi:competence protein ComEC